jgi:hypothetical protein
MTVTPIARNKNSRDASFSVAKKYRAQPPKTIGNKTDR